ncbi:hypothetical protein MFIFM68171_09090 [Madurella fahalii]|uniref:Putative transcription factor kapC n=1 Tax=Madurella fahalii TaxID=1157608 RepID=A0ABQ0GMC4_9PEZI
MSSNTSIKHEPNAREHPVAPPPVVAQGDQAAYPNPSFPNHSQPVPEAVGVNRASPASAAPVPTLPHGYSQTPLPQSESLIHPELRSGHEPAATTAGYAPVPTMIPPGVAPPSDQAVAMSGPPTSVISPVGMVDQGEGAADGRKAKRELSQSKRAAQNRAAQRAFRQRKEGYIKKLEQQVRDFTAMEVSYKELQAENYSLREYVIHLQSRLLDTQGEYPQPPANINLSHPNSQPPPTRGGPDSVQTAGQGPGANPLEVAAQAVAGLSRSEHLAGRDPYAAGRTDDDVRTAEEITRQLQEDGTQDALPAASM